MCPCLFPDTPITYFLCLLRLLILWVKTERVAPASMRNSIMAHHLVTTQGSTLVMYTVSVGRATFSLEPPQCSDCETIRGPRHSLASGALPPPVPWLFVKGACHRPSSSVPLVHTGHTGPVWVPLGLVVHHSQTGPERPASPSVGSEWTKPLPSFGPFVYISLGAFSLFGHIPIIEN